MQRWAMMLLLTALAPQACAPDPPVESTGLVIRDDRVLATTPLLAEVLEVVAGSRLEVVLLPPPDADPRTYVPGGADSDRCAGTRAVFQIGLDLEQGMEPFLARLQERGCRRFSVAEEVPVLRRLRRTDGTWDPAVWTGIPLWAHALNATVKGLSDLYPGDAALFLERAEEHLEDLQKLHARCLEQIGRIPPERRVLVTDCAGYGYFGRAYGLEVHALEGADEEAREAALRRVREARVPAVFYAGEEEPEILRAFMRDARLGGFEPEMAEPLPLLADGRLGADLQELETLAERVADALCGGS